MKPKIWNLIVLAVLFITVGSFVFIFRENKRSPELLNIPYVFWTGFLVTALIVLATYLGSRFFPYHDTKEQ
ncbi:hypothetical protein [Aquiflexum sp.]|uniref:hypothetical protein n=1 Tax=Aquiflexum sp. TaxID=1872584 RepID=UPI00359413F4